MRDIQKNLTLKNDVIFKELFSKKGNEEFLQNFLSDFLKVNIEKIEICKDAALTKERVEEKYGILDIKATLNDSSIINIEMQVTNYNNMKKRVVYYAGKFIIVDKDYRNYEILKSPKFYFIELPKFRKRKIDEKNITEQWLSFIDGENPEGVSRAMKNNNVIKKANKEYEYLTGIERIKRLALLREMALRDKMSHEKYIRTIAMKEGYEQGIEQGKKEEKILIAKSLIENGISIKIVAKSTGIPIDELKKMK